MHGDAPPQHAHVAIRFWLCRAIMPAALLCTWGNCLSCRCIHPLLPHVAWSCLVYTPRGRVSTSGRWHSPSSSIGIFWRQPLSSCEPRASKGACMRERTRQLPSDSSSARSSSSSCTNGICLRRYSFAADLTGWRERLQHGRNTIKCRIEHSCVAHFLYRSLLFCAACTDTRFLRATIGSAKRLGQPCSQC